MTRDIIVSVRIPRTLILELKENVKYHHYKDLSELIRTILRRQYLNSQDPRTLEIQSIRKDLNEKLDKAIREKGTEQFIQELESIMKRMVEDKK